MLKLSIAILALCGMCLGNDQYRYITKVQYIPYKFHSGSMNRLERGFDAGRRVVRIEEKELNGEELGAGENEAIVMDNDLNAEMNTDKDAGQEFGAKKKEAKKNKISSGESEKSSNEQQQEEAIEELNDDDDKYFFMYPKYKYEYGVKDEKTGDHKSHWESRDGDVVTGEYTISEPDGTQRIVKYKADAKNGFVAEVKTIGKVLEQEKGVDEMKREQRKVNGKNRHSNNKLKKHERS